MKSIVAIALVVLFGAATAFTAYSPYNNAKWTKAPTAKCGNSSVEISGMCTGLGTGPYFARITGYYDCVNHGKQVPDADGWSEVDVIVDLATKTNLTGGNVKATALLESLCDHANWTFKTKDLVITLYGSYADAQNQTNALVDAEPITPDCF